MEYNEPLTWEMIEDVIDDTLCNSLKNYLFEDIEDLRYNYKNEDREISWFRFKRKYRDLQSDEKWDYFSNKRFKHN
jgi:hypothetical protein